MDVLGGDIRNPARTAHLVQQLRCERAFARWRHQFRMAFELRNRACRASCRTWLWRAWSWSWLPSWGYGRFWTWRKVRAPCLGPGGFLPARSPNDLYPDPAVQHRDAVRDLGRAREPLDLSRERHHAHGGWPRSLRGDYQICFGKTGDAARRRVTCIVVRVGLVGLAPSHGAIGEERTCPFRMAS